MIVCIILCPFVLYNKNNNTINNMRNENNGYKKWRTHELTGKYLSIYNIYYRPRVSQ